MSNTRKRSWPRRLLRAVALLVLAWIALGIVAVLVLRFVPPLASSVMLQDWIGARLARDDAFELRYRWTPWEQVAPALPIALVAAEDQKFPLHHGFDIDAIRDALAEAGEGERLRGASTISQQVAKNLFLWNGRSFVRKGLEAWFTLLIETLWPKQRILEVYLNIAEFGHGTYGAGAASERYFRITPARLSPHQAALLAAVLPNPIRLRVDRPSPYVLRRAAWIQRQAKQLGGADYLR
ncbi:MAG TPA: monofunctional biosynthetic peptidoglycan transglycosylase [Dokdonella sp.]